jgi:hypothetical protein
VSLRSWLELDDAARYLETALGEPVSQTDILQLVLEGHVPLALNLMVDTEARSGRGLRIPRIVITSSRAS